MRRDLELRYQSLYPLNSKKPGNFYSKETGLIEFCRPIEILTRGEQVVRIRKTENKSNSD